MKTHAHSVSAHLQGDWTITGVVRQMDWLMALSSQLDQTCTAIDIECSGITGIDRYGFQLLYAWMHCLEIRGYKATLINNLAAVPHNRNSFHPAIKKFPNTPPFPNSP